MISPLFRPGNHFEHRLVFWTFETFLLPKRYPENQWLSVTLDLSKINVPELKKHTTSEMRDKVQIFCRKDFFIVLTLFSPSYIELLSSLIFCFHVDEQYRPVSWFVTWKMWNNWTGYLLRLPESSWRYCT